MKKTYSSNSGMRDKKVIVSFELLLIIKSENIFSDTFYDSSLLPRPHLLSQSPVTSSKIISLTF